MSTSLQTFLQTHPYGANGAVRDDYRPDIVGKTGTLPSIEAVQTLGTGVGSRLFTVFNNQQAWILTPGAADATDPGHVAPLDYDATVNNVHWEQKG